jgi:hypothetical protein
MAFLVLGALTPGLLATFYPFGDNVWAETAAHRGPVCPGS